MEVETAYLKTFFFKDGKVFSLHVHTSNGTKLQQLLVNSSFKNTAI